MSLYDDIDDATTKKPELSGWNSNYKLLQSQLKSKKSNLNAKRQKTSDSSFESKSLHIPSIRPGRSGIPRFHGSDTDTNFFGTVDEYDPMKPNDYETVVARLRKEREAERAKAERSAVKEGEISDDSDEGARDDALPRQAGAAIAPPQSIMEEPPAPTAGPTLSGSGKFNFAGQFANKIMAKYGFKEGAGLGKDEQGMSTALIVQKTGRVEGKILHERDVAKQKRERDEQAEASKLDTAELLKNPTKCIMLRNMVGPGDVDNDLQGEVQEECTKYGKVAKVLILELPNTSPEEAVRIFVEFERIENAIKAVIDLNGRFFGGRLVNAKFYNLDKFRRLDLGADPL